MNVGGTTLLELVCVLVLVGVGVGVLAPSVRRQADALTVRGLREEVVGLIRSARAEARIRGEATVVLEEGADPVLVSEGGRSDRRVDLGGRGVRMEIAGSRSSVTLRFGPLGIARWGSASFVLQKGGARAPIVVSSHGRVRR